METLISEVSTKQKDRRRVLMFLPGEDFDQRIMEYFMKLIKRKHGKDISSDVKAVQKLRREAERAKRTLSNQHQVRVEIEALLMELTSQNP